MHLFACEQVFTYLDRWCKTHKFDGDGKKVAPIYLIFVVDGRIDPYKKNRNYGHELKRKKIDALRRKLKDNASALDAGDLHR